MMCVLQPPYLFIYQWPIYFVSHFQLEFYLFIWRYLCSRKHYTGCYIYFLRFLFYQLNSVNLVQIYSKLFIALFDDTFLDGHLSKNLK